MSFKQCHWCGILNWIKLNVYIKSEINKQYADSIMKLGGTKKKKHSKFYGFSTICKYVSFSKTTIHQALAIAVISFENVAYFLFGVHPWQLWFISTNKKRINRTFVKLKVYCKFCCVQPEDWPWQFYADSASSLMNSLHEHCHLSTADNSYPAHCYIPNDTMPENQTPQLVHSVNCDNDWDTPHFPC